MRTVTRRIAKLENRFSPTEGKPQLLLVACHAGWGLALARDTCLGILGECGFLPTGRIGIVNFLNIPFHTSAEELERFLREKGAETCGLNTMVRRDCPC